MLGRFSWEAARALGVMAGVAAVGLGSAHLEGTHTSYPDAEMSPADPASNDEGAPARPPRVWLVDGFNVLHAGVLVGRDRASWWSEERRAQLLAVVERFEAEREDAEIWVVFDGPSAAEHAAGDGRRVHVAFAPSADEWLLARVRAAREPVCVVTSDRQLAERARHRGAEIVPPRRFLARCRSS